MWTLLWKETNTQRTTAKIVGDCQVGGGTTKRKTSNVKSVKAVRIEDGEVAMANDEKNNNNINNNNDTVAASSTEGGNNHTDKNSNDGHKQQQQQQQQLLQQ